MNYLLEESGPGTISWIYEKSSAGWTLAWSNQGGQWIRLQNMGTKKTDPREWAYGSPYSFIELTKEEMFALLL